MNWLRRLLSRSSNWHQQFARAPLDAGGGTKLASPFASAWVFSAIQKITSQVLAAPLVFRAAPRGELLRDSGERAARWQSPALGADGHLSWEELVEITLTWVLVQGQAFWILDDAGVMTISRPDRVQPVLVQGVLSHWTWRDGAGRQHLLLPEQVIRPRIPHPSNDLEGLSAFEAARLAAEGDHAAAAFAKNIMESNGDRGAYVIAKDGLTDEQRVQIEASLREKRALNRRGIFSLSFLTGDVTIEDPKVASVDAQFLSTRQASRQEIYAALGLPMSMAEVTASYSVGSASDRFRLIEETCLPLGRRLCAAVSEVERRLTKLRVWADLDWSRHSTLKQVRGEFLDRAAAMHARGVPWSVLNESLDLGLAPFPGWDRAWLPMSLQSVEEGEAFRSESPEEDAPEVEDHAEALKALLRAPVSISAADAVSERGAAERALGGARSANPERVALWQRYMRLRAPAEKVFRTQFSKALQAARKETLKRLEQTRSLEGYRQRGILDVLFDLADFTIRLLDGMRGAHENALLDAAVQLTEELGLSDPWRMPDPAAARFLKSRENKIKDAAKAVHEDIKASIQEGLDAKESIEQIGARVRESFNKADKERSEMIATTECAAAFGAAREQGLADAGIEEKEWLSAQDDRVRLSHAEADGQVVPVGEAFIVDGEPLQHPGDPDGSAKNVINCRCVVVAHVKGGGE